MIDDPENALSIVVPADEPHSPAEPEAEPAAADQISQPTVAEAGAEGASTAPVEPTGRAQPVATPAGTRREARRGAHRFKVQFRAQALVEAEDIGDALRQAASLGATDILAITREA
jgi:hypothetical protein